MRFAAVLFDLWGTLVPPFRRKEHLAVLSACSERLGIGFDDLHRLWLEAGSRRFRGDHGTVAEHFAWILHQRGCHATQSQLEAAQDVYLRFASEGLLPAAGAVDALTWLRAHGIRLGVVSNCASDVPQVWTETPFAGLFDVRAFSCEVGAVKPDARIYQHALSALGVRPEDSLYIGDGSSEELSGAARCGMHPMLIAVDLSNTYDPSRLDVDTWTGPTIRVLAEVPALMAGEAP